MHRLICFAILAAFAAVTSPSFAQEDGPPVGLCASDATSTDFYAAGWDYGTSNERFQSRTSINQGNVDQLAVKWAFRLEGGVSPHSHPLVSGDTVYIGTQAGQVHALDKETGCIRWTFQDPEMEEARTGIIVGTIASDDDDGEGDKATIFFGSTDGRMHALDAATGALIWVNYVGDHSMTMLTGTPTFHDGKIYVPISSTEVVYAMMPWYGCCSFRGNVVSLDAATGEILWRTHVIQEELVETGTHHLFVQTRGPSGAPIWSSPLVDPERGLIYVGTGENYSSPANGTSDSIIAMDMQTGEIRWVQQYLEGDAFNVACGMEDHGNCPEEDGPDFDFGAPPILTETIDGTPIMLAGQKSGGVYAMNPDTGERIWEEYIGRGGLIGGIHWGMAVNKKAGLLFVPVSDMLFPFNPAEGEPEPGLFALDIKTGKRLWQTNIEDACKGRDLCNIGLSAGIVATEDLVFAGGLDARIRAYDPMTGDVLWTFDTLRDYDAVNGGVTSGGTIDTHGPVVAGDMLFVQSGYAHQILHGGNVLVAFQLKRDGQLTGDSE